MASNLIVMASTVGCNGAAKLSSKRRSQITRRRLLLACAGQIVSTNAGLLLKVVEVGLYMIYQKKRYTNNPFETRSAPIWTVRSRQLPRSVTSS